jgi:hypothetical protein
MFINKETIVKARTFKSAMVVNIAEDRPVSDDLLAGFVMASLGENPSSLFGWDVHRSNDGTMAVVTLNTD